MSKASAQEWKQEFNKDVWNYDDGRCMVIAFYLSLIVDELRRINGKGVKIPCTKD